MNGHRRRGFSGRGEFGFAAGKEDGDGSALVSGGSAGFNGDAAAVFLDDALTDPEAEACAVLPLGGEEGLEETVAVSGGDASTLVVDDDGDAGASAWGRDDAREDLNDAAGR